MRIFVIVRLLKILITKNIIKKPIGKILISFLCFFLFSISTETIDPKEEEIIPANSLGVPLVAYPPDLWSPQYTFNDCNSTLPAIVRSSDFSYEIRVISYLSNSSKKLFWSKKIPSSGPMPLIYVPEKGSFIVEVRCTMETCTQSSSCGSQCSKKTFVQSTDIQSWPQANYFFPASDWYVDNEKCC